MRCCSSLFVALALCVSLSLVGCGDDDGTGPGVDGGGVDASADAGSGGDAGSDAGRDAGGRADAGPSCTTGCDILQVVAGFQHTCVRRMNGTVLCWGRNYDGELGDDSMSHTDCNMAIGGEYLDCAPRPVMVVMLTDAADISAHAGRTTCARRTSGEVVCWGLEEVLRSGATRQTKRFSPVARTELMGAMVVAPGDSHTCAVISGSVVCLGDNQNGEVGDGTFVRRADPVAVAMPTDVSEIETGAMGSTTCARSGGQVYCWGANDSRQLGDGAGTMHSSCVAGTSRYDCSNVAVAVAGVTDATDIGVGSSHACAVFASHHVVCWGANFDGQLGTGDELDHADPTEVVGITDAVEVVAGATHTCVRKMDGTVACWGSNRRGELGDDMMEGHTSCTLGGTTQDCSRSPVTVSGLTGATQLTAGMKHNCALTSTGDVYCWGFNENKQIGNGVIADVFAPHHVTGF